VRVRAREHDWKNRPQRQTDYRCPGGAHGYRKAHKRTRGGRLSNVSIPGANLESHADLSGANLSGTDLSGANLRNADLTGARVTKADLSGVDLFGANLSGTDLSGANLGNADLFGARLVKANLGNADLTGARVTKANLSGANLSGANLLGTRGLTQTQLDEACGDANTKLPEGFTPLKPCS
jgi:uncharacterized protein YjbI with pentapeptide repeats